MVAFLHLPDRVACRSRAVALACKRVHDSICKHGAVQLWGSSRKISVFPGLGRGIRDGSRATATTGLCDKPQVRGIREPISLAIFEHSQQIPVA